MRKHRVQCLLMGGQACVLYGAAEFSRDADLHLIVGRPAKAALLATAITGKQCRVLARDEPSFPFAP